MAPHALTTHFKNYRVIRTGRGLALENCALGDGEIDLAAIAELLAAHRPRINLNIEIHTQFAPFALDILDETYFQRHPSPPGDGLAWYLRKAWRKPIPTALPATLPDGPPSWQREQDDLRQSVRWAKQTFSPSPLRIARNLSWLSKRRHADGRKMIRIGMLGCGFMGKCHSNAYKTIPYIYAAAGLMPRLDLLCDKQAEVAAREAARYGFERFCTDWNELAADDRIEVLDNCGPDPGPSGALHRRLASRQARDLREADGHLAWPTPGGCAMPPRPAPGKAMCTFNYRFMPAVRLAKDLIAEGRIGTVYHIRGNYLQMAGHDPSLRPDKAWSSAWPHSGGLQGIGSHAIDQCRFLPGEIKSVSALVRDLQRPAPSPARATRTSSPTKARRPCWISKAAPSACWSPPSWPRAARITSPGKSTDRKGSLKWDMEHPNSLFACLEGQDGARLLGFAEISVTEPEHPYVGPWWPQGHNLGWEHSHIIEKFHFLDAVAHGRPLCPYNATFEDGYRVAVIIAAMRESSRSGRRIEVSY